MKPSIPSCFEELSREWIQQSLSARFPGVKISDVHIEPLPGYKPNKVRAKLLSEFTGPGGPPDSVVIKGGFARHIKSEYAQDLKRPLDLGMEMEARAYRHYVPTVEVETPECFYVDVSDGTGVVVMEDLDARNGAFFTPFQPMRYKEALNFIDAHATIHARWWNDPELESGNLFGPETRFGQCGRRIHTEYLAEFHDQTLWDSIMLNPHNAGLPRCFRDRSKMVDAFRLLAEANRAVARTIVHGDEHLKNFYTTPDGAAGFADWNSRVEPWANDYAYFVTSCLDIVDRRAWERLLLERYLNTLRKSGVDAPSFEEAWLAYRRAVVFPLYCWIINNSALQPASVNCAYNARCAVAALDLNSFEALGV